MWVRTQNLASVLLNLLVEKKIDLDVLLKITISILAKYSRMGTFQEECAIFLKLMSSLCEVCFVVAVANSSCQSFYSQLRVFTVSFYYISYRYDDNQVYLHFHSSVLPFFLNSNILMLHVLNCKSFIIPGEIFSNLVNYSSYKDDHSAYVCSFMKPI